MSSWVYVLDICHHSGMWVGCFGIGILCVKMLSSSCWQCSGLVSVWCVCIWGCCCGMVCGDWVDGRGMFTLWYM